MRVTAAKLAVSWPNRWAYDNKHCRKRRRKEKVQMEEMDKKLMTVLNLLATELMWAGDLQLDGCFRWASAHKYAWQGAIVKEETTAETNEPVIRNDDDRFFCNWNDKSLGLCLIAMANGTMLLDLFGRQFFDSRKYGWLLAAEQLRQQRTSKTTRVDIKFFGKPFEILD